MRTSEPCGVRGRVKKLLIAIGTTRAARELGMDREVLLGIAAGARVRTASLVMAEVRLDRREARPDPPRVT